MKTQPARSQPGFRTPPHPLWMRLLTVFCMALLAVVSTVQVCHTHDELHPVLAASSPSASLQVSAQPVAPANSPPDTNSAVNCPLCVAMHSALPVTHHLTQVALQLLAPSAAAPVELFTRILWRSDLTSRPPPAAPFLA